MIFFILESQQVDKDPPIRLATPLLPEHHVLIQRQTVLQHKVIYKYSIFLDFFSNLRLPLHARLVSFDKAVIDLQDLCVCTLSNIDEVLAIK